MTNIGAGKTASLAAANRAWLAAGVDVQGTALAAVTARRLADATGIPSCSLARLLADADQPDPATGQPRGLSPGGIDAAFAIPDRLADPPAAPPMPHVEFSQPANQGLWADLTVRLPELESPLPSITIPFGVIVGELSPMPPSAGTDSAEHIPGAWSHVEPGAGHFVWHEAPGCIVAAMDRLVADPSEAESTPSLSGDR